MEQGVARWNRGSLEGTGVIRWNRGSLDGTGGH